MVKSERAPQEQEALYTEENNGSWWDVGTRVSKEEARRRWPDRLIAGLDSPQALCEDEERKVAEAHFEAIRVEDVGMVTLGSCVDVESAEHAGYHMVATVEELYQDSKGERWMGISWFYKQFDTSLKCVDKDGVCTLPMELDPKMLFKANSSDNKKYSTVLSINTINRLVTVVYRVPGGEKPQDCDYYWSMYHDRLHNTFIDSFEEPPASQDLHAGNEGPRELNTLELYCGCGGLSFADRHTEDVVIETKWAVDLERSMIETFKANYPYAHGHIIGVDEFLELCKLWKRLTDKFPEGWKNPNPKARQTCLFKGDDSDEGCEKEVVEILSMTIMDKGTKGKTGQGKGHILINLKEGDTWLEFGVLFKGETGMQWVREDCMDCDGLLAPFVQKLRAINYIPLPGDVDIIMGGPPCQGVSGLNRHGKTKEIIDDPRNRQVLAFYKTIEWFQPSYVLMENVLDIFKKGDGLYAKMAATTLLNLDYQTRTGVIAAAHHGAPQGRWRAFMWGAKSGKEQLPPFPEPTFAAGFACGVPRAATECVVGFQSVEAFDKAHQMTFLGDILSDLPRVSNFAVSDRSTYQSKPKTPMQRFLRRDPPAWAANKYSRAENAVRAMASTQEDMASRIKTLTHLIDPSLAVGAAYLCSKGSLKDNDRVGNRTDMFAAEVVRSTTQLLAAKDKKAAANFKFNLEWSKSALSHRIGKHVLDQNGYRFVPCDPDSDDDEDCGDRGDWVQDEPEDFLAVKGKLSDHRPLTVNADDFLRCANVPRVKAANYRDFPGVISHWDETCCSGSTHAATYAKAKNAKITACQGGGTRTVTQGGNAASCRVDHADNGGWRGPFLQGCSAFTRLMPTGDLLCPRWCITYKKGKSEGRHGCYGRMWFDEIQSTIVGRAEPHNLRLVHPWQHRVATIRENARCQGFPDYFTFVGLGTNKSSSSGWVRHTSLTVRYQQLGNAVSPLVADALGRCLARAAVGKAPVGAFVIGTPSPELDKAFQEARQNGLKTYVEFKGIPQTYRRHINKMRKAAEDLRALGMAEALKVLNEAEEDAASEDAVKAEEDAEEDCKDDIKPPPKRRKKAAGAEKAPL